MKFINVYEVPKGRTKGIKIPGVSITQPDEALTIEQILLRVSQGLTTGVGASVNDDDYDDPNDEDFDDPTLQPGFDTLDALEYANSEQSEKLRSDVEEHKKRKKKKEQDDLFEAEVQKRLAAEKEKSEDK